MPFTFANINNRSALVKSDLFYDLSAITNDAVSADPMEAINDSTLLHQYGDKLADFEPSGLVVEADLYAPIPQPRNSYGVASTTSFMLKKLRQRPLTRQWCSRNFHPVSVALPMM